MNAIFTPAAHADGAVPLGGVAGITVNGTPCTLTTIGHDTLVHIGFTAAHCGGPGTTVIAALGAETPGPIGTVATVSPDLDYAATKKNPSMVTPTAIVLAGPAYAEPVPTADEVVAVLARLAAPGIPAASKTDVVSPGFAPDEAGTIDNHLDRMAAFGGAVPPSLTLTIRSAVRSRST